MSNNFSLIFSNKILGASLLACFLAQALKILFYYFQEKKLDITRIIGSGGMPSSHSSFVCALTTCVGIESGFNSPLFALSFVFSMIVMYDASGVRKSVGEQAKILNVIVKKIENHENDFEKELKELIGHTKLEVFWGAILGILISVLFYI
jgi:acid phosphatase family membrane protein YuiD